MLTAGRVEELLARSVLFLAVLIAIYGLTLVVLVAVIDFTLLPVVFLVQVALHFLPLLLRHLVSVLLLISIRLLVAVVGRALDSITILVVVARRLLVLLIFVLLLWRRDFLWRCVMLGRWDILALLWVVKLIHSALCKSHQALRNQKFLDECVDHQQFEELSLNETVAITFSSYCFSETATWLSCFYKFGS